MKRILLTFFLLAMLIQVSANAQDFLQRLTHPNEVGGSFVATHADGIGESTSCGPGFELFVKYNLNPNLFITGGIGYLTAMDKFMGSDLPGSPKMVMFPSFEMKVGYNLTNSNVKPLVFAGLQGFGFYGESGGVKTDTYFDASLIGGGGVSFQVNDNLAIQATGDLRYVFTAESDNNLFYAAKAGVSYALNPGRRSTRRDEMEYPVSDSDLALDELFQETPSTSNNSNQMDEQDALALLFQNDNESSLEAFEESGTNTDYDAVNELFNMNDDTPTEDVSNEEVGQLYARIQTMKNQMEGRLREIEDLKSQVRSNERAIAEMSGRMAGEYTGESFGVVSSESFKTSYEVGLQKFYDRKYKDAIRIFKGLLTSNPDHRLSSNCQYWIGESYNAMGNYQEAIAAFQRVMNFKSSYKFDDALLMSGLVHMKLGDQNTARDNFQQLVSRFPDSEYAPKAMRYLGRF